MRIVHVSVGQGPGSGGPGFWSRAAFSWLSNVVALFVASALPGVSFGGEFWVLLAAAAVLAALNLLLRPLALLLALPLIVLTLGLGLLLVSGLMLWLVDRIVGPFEVGGFWSVVGAAAIVAVVNTALAALLRPDRPRRDERA
ncbi:MAG: phage holin family protein [Thermoleophilia bacterium]